MGMYRINRKILAPLFRLIILLAFTVLTLYPVIWMVSGSLKDQAEFYNNIWGIPSVFHFENYVRAWEWGALGEKYLNSIIVTFGFLALIIPANCCSGYVLARMEFKGRKFFYIFLLAGMMVPGGVLGMPTFTVALNLGLVNTLYGIILIYAGHGCAFGMFMMYQFYLTIPKSLEEAAMIDGSSRFGAFLRVILPLAVPGIMTQVIFSGLATWNEYFLGSLILRREEVKALPIGLLSFMSDTEIYYPQLFAALSITTLPIVIIYLFAQRTFIEGVTAGAVKG